VISVADGSFEIAPLPRARAAADAAGVVIGTAPLVSTGGQLALSNRVVGLTAGEPLALCSADAEVLADRLGVAAGRDQLVQRFRTLQRLA
jgi:hypothetical protein